MPDANAVMPKPRWNMRGSKTGVAPTATRNRTPAQTPMAKVCIRKAE